MARRDYTSEQIIHKLREAAVLLAQDQSVQQATRQIEVTEQTTSSKRRWRLMQKTSEPGEATGGSVASLHDS